MPGHVLSHKNCFFEWGIWTPSKTYLLWQVQLFCTAHVRVSSGMSGHAIPPQNFPFPWGSEPHLIRGSFGPPDSASQTASSSVQPFYTDLSSVPILYSGPPLPPQNCPSHGDVDRCRFLGPTWVLINTTTSRSVQPFLQGSLMWQTDRQTDRPRYAVCNNRPHLRIRMRCGLIIEAKKCNGHILFEGMYSGK